MQAAITTNPRRDFFFMMMSESEKFSSECFIHFNGFEKTRGEKRGHFLIIFNNFCEHKCYYVVNFSAYIMG